MVSDNKHYLLQTDSLNFDILETFVEAQICY